MLERLFAGTLLLLAGGYLLLASQYEAPFAYEPLGPRGFPYIIGVAIAVSMLWLVVRPSNMGAVFSSDKTVRSAVTLVAVIVYGLLFEPLGFVLATGVVGTAISLFLGHGLRSAILFNWVGSIIIYVLLVYVLDLNLPEMPLVGI